MFIYPALQQLCLELCFDDQFAFRPAGLTTATVIALLHTVCTMLSTDQYVNVYSFDFTKAFDTARYEALTSEMVELNISDNNCNCIKAFLRSIVTVQDMPGNALPLQQWKPASFKIPDLVQPRSSSLLRIYIQQFQGTAFSNLPTTHTWWYQRQTQVLDYKNISQRNLGIH